MRITVQEALDLGIWGYLADAQDVEPWAIKEGQIDLDDDLEISVEQFKEWVE